MCKGLFQETDRHTRVKSRSLATSAVSIALVALGLLATPPGVLAQGPAPPPICASGQASVEDLTLLRAVRATIDVGERKCFRVILKRGDFARLSIEVDSVFALVQVLAPGESRPLLQVERGRESRWPVSWEAKLAGSYWVVLDAGPRFERAGSGTFSVQIDQVLPVADRQREHKRLAADPRVAWLREHTEAVRTIDPNDGDLADLDFLASWLRDARVVLLGESHLGNGSDFLAKTRLIRFLHRRLGFDVLAFEAGLYDMAQAWHSVQSGRPPREAFAQGVWRVWIRAEQFLPLVEYVTQAAQSGNPLQLAGFDLQFTGSASRDSLVRDLAGVLRTETIDSPLAQGTTKERRILQSLTEGAYLRGDIPLPSSEEQQALVEALRRAVAEIERTSRSPEREFWAQVLRSAALQASITFAELSKDAPFRVDVEYQRARDEQMAENLVWLARRYFSNRKIIVWAHTGHLMRNPQLVPSTTVRQTTMGHRVWEALGEEVFVIGFTSYEGAYHWATQPDDLVFTIVSDQHTGPEFEEMMRATGRNFALVNLREAARARSWLGGSFLARPLLHITERAPWSRVLDAIFFVRNQEPSRTLSNVR